MGLLFSTSGGEAAPRGLLLLSSCTKGLLTTISRAFQVPGKAKKHYVVVLFQGDTLVFPGQLALKVQKINDHLCKPHLRMDLSNAASHCLRELTARSSQCEFIEKAHIFLLCLS